MATAFVCAQFLASTVDLDSILRLVIGSAAARAICRCHFIFTNIRSVFFERTSTEVANLIEII